MSLVCQRSRGSDLGFGGMVPDTEFSFGALLKAPDLVVGGNVDCLLCRRPGLHLEIDPRFLLCRSSARYWRHAYQSLNTRSFGLFVRIICGWKIIARSSLFCASSNCCACWGVICITR